MAGQKRKACLRPNDPAIHVFLSDGVMIAPYSNMPMSARVIYVATCRQRRGCAGRLA